MHLEFISICIYNMRIFTPSKFLLQIAIPSSENAPVYGSSSGGMRGYPGQPAHIAFDVSIYAYSLKSEHVSRKCAVNHKI
jgi:hypothetical protein